MHALCHAFAAAVALKERVNDTRGLLLTLHWVFLFNYHTHTQQALKQAKNFEVRKISRRLAQARTEAAAGGAAGGKAGGLWEG